jgi:formylmethanofuran:tetrahydromethanopterin formyltransferase
MKLNIMNKVADTIVSYLLAKNSHSKKSYCKVDFSSTKKRYLGNIDGKVYDSAELDVIYKVCYEVCINGVKETEISKEWLPRRCLETFDDKDFAQKHWV